MSSFTRNPEIPDWLASLGKDFDPAPQHYYHFAIWAKVAFLTEKYRKNTTVYEGGAGGFVEAKTVEAFEKEIKKLCAEMNLAFTNNLGEKLEVPPEDEDDGLDEDTPYDPIRGDSSGTWYLWDKDTLVNVTFYAEDQSTVSVFSTDQARVKSVTEAFSKCFVKRSERRGRVHLLEAGCDGIQINELGKGGQKFCPENYEEDVASSFEFIAEQLTHKDPVGRLFILDGPPGTGKTYFVKGLLDAVENAVFLLVPSHQIGKLSDPSFSPAIRLLSQREKAPIILILEDADQALLPRHVTNMSTISDLLNYADGIVGTIVDIRILATTNAKNMEIEPALKRKRRLGKRIHVGGLSVRKVKEIYARLIAGQDVVREVELPTEDGKLTLAEVYNLADVALGKVEPDKEEETKEVQTAGFHNQI